MKSAFPIFACLLLLLCCACGNKTKTAQTAKGVEQPTPATPETATAETKTAIKEPAVETPVVEQPAPEPAPVLPWVMTSIRKSSCYGKCPVFEFRIFSDGRLEYHGRRFVEMEGIYEAQAPEGMLDEITNEANKAGYLSLADTYPTEGRRIPDLPSTYTTVNFGEAEKKIRNNHNAPKALIAFEKYLVSLIDKVSWKQVKQE